MEKQVTLLGWLYIIFNGLILGLAVTAYLINLNAAEPLLGFSDLLFFALISFPGLVGGFGLIRRWPWIRNLMLLIGVVSLINVPFGTALGIYTLWLLLKPEAKQLFISRQ